MSEVLIFILMLAGYFSCIYGVRFIAGNYHRIIPQSVRFSLFRQTKSIAERLNLSVAIPPKKNWWDKKYPFIYGTYKGKEVKIGISSVKGMASEVYYISIICPNKNVEFDLKRQDFFTMEMDQSKLSRRVMLQQIPRGLTSNHNEDFYEVINQEVETFLTQHEGILSGNIHWNNNELTYGEIYISNDAFIDNTILATDTMIRLANMLTKNVQSLETA